jgi:glycosyltransferase involved in cell wall biosynthesis
VSTAATDYRLCLVNSMRTWGGAEVWMLETALALRERGCAVQFVTNDESELAGRASAAGLPVMALPIRIDGAPWTIAALTRHFRRTGVTAVVANTTKDVKVAAPAARLAGVPVVLATRESDFPLKDRLDYRWNFQVLCTGVLVNSEATRRTILASGPWLDPDRVHLLYKGIDIEHFAPGPDPVGRPVVGVVGQLIERKGIPEVMRAWSVIDRQERTVRPVLRLAGEGILRGDLERWRTTLDHPQDVELIGYTEDVAQFYRGLHILAMPSHAEGFGLAAAEALACGVPVIAGDASSLPEIVSDGETGLLVPPGDAEALCAALQRLLDDPSLARRLGQAGRRSVVARYPRDKTLDRFLELTGHTATGGV